MRAGKLDPLRRWDCRTAAVSGHQRQALETKADWMKGLRDGKDMSASALRRRREYIGPAHALVVKSPDYHRILAIRTHFLDYDH